MSDPSFLDDWQSGDVLTAEQMRLIKTLLQKKNTGVHWYGDTTGFAFGRQKVEHRIVWVQNNSSADRVQGDILGLADVLASHQAPGQLSRFWTEAVYSGSESSDELKYKYGVLLHDCNHLGTMPCMVSGECCARVNIQHKDHKFAHGDQEGNILISDYGGNAHIFWKEDDEGTGIMWCRVRLSNPGEFQWRYIEIFDAVTKLGGPFTGYLREWDADTDTWGTGAETVEFHEVLNIYSKPLTTSGQAGNLGAIRKDPDSEQWELMVMEPVALFIEFTLTDALYSGDATATVDDFCQGHDPGDYTWVGGFKVHDPQGQFPRAISGCKGVAYYDDDDGQYEVIHVQQAAQTLRGTASPFDSTDATIAVTGVAVVNRQGDVLPPGITAFKNLLSCHRTTSGLVYATWDQGEQDYVAFAPYEYTTVTIDVLAKQAGDTGPLDVDDTDYTFGYYLTEITVIAKGAEGSRQVWYTGDLCS